MSWSNYKGLSVPDVTPSAAGAVLADDLRTLADRIGQCNYLATTDPTAGDDETAGYSTGSIDPDSSVTIDGACSYVISTN